MHNSFLRMSTSKSEENHTFLIPTQSNSKTVFFRKRNTSRSTSTIFLDNYFALWISWIKWQPLSRSYVTDPTDLFRKFLFVETCIFFSSRPCIRIVCQGINSKIMKCDKTTGSDGVPIEAFKYCCLLMQNVRTWTVTERSTMYKNRHFRK